MALDRQPLTQRNQRSSELRAARGKGGPTSPVGIRMESSSSAGGVSMPASTMPRWSGEAFPPTGEGPYWSRGDGDGLNVRCGLDNIKPRQKTESHDCMSETISCDAVKASPEIETVIGTLVKELPEVSPCQGEGGRGGGDMPQWSRDYE